MGYIRDEELSKEDLRKQLDQAHRRWQEIARFGCNDPLWSDGINLNLVRNHILYYTNLIQEREKEGEQISFLDFPDNIAEIPPVPPVVPAMFMVKNGAYANRLNRTYLKKDLEQLVYGSIEDYM